MREKVSVDFDHLLSISTCSSKYSPLILSTDISYLDSPDDLTNTLIDFRTIFLDNMGTRNSARFEPNFLNIPDSHTENTLSKCSNCSQYVFVGVVLPVSEHEEIPTFLCVDCRGKQQTTPYDENDDNHTTLSSLFHTKLQIA